MLPLAMTTAQRYSLTEGSQWVEQAGKLLANLGFQLLEAEGGAINGGHLLVAIRPSPTLQHFDPEHISYWVTEGGRGRAAQLDREAKGPLEAPFAWGSIVVADRLAVTNQFVAFGGLLRVQTTGDAMLCDFSSSAPILRWSGHSQGSDPLTAEVGAFFGRIKIPIDFVPGAEELIARAAPKTLYCAFVQDVRERLAGARMLREANRWLAEWAPREAQRLDAASGENWKAALELRRQLGLVEAVARE